MMESSYENSTLRAGGNINSHNTLNVQGVHHHAHHHHATHCQPGISMSAKAQLRCPLPSSKFVGRKEELRRLREFFTSSEVDRKSFAVIGMGGCGKSQIASEFTHGHVLKDNMYDPSRVFFVDGTSLATLEESYASIAQSNGVGSSPHDALLWLSNTQEATFVLIDNADDPSLDLNVFIPRSLNVHILITTRLHDKGRQYASTSDAFMDLTALSTEEAEELLVRTAMVDSDQLEDISVLVQELYCHALAVAQAGACIAYLHLSVDKYLERFRRVGISLMDDQNDDVEYSKAVRHTWELSYDRLPQSSKDLFNLCAFLHHGGITQALFQKATDALATYKPGAPLSPVEEAAFVTVTKVLESCHADQKTFDDFSFQQRIAPILEVSLMRCDPITRVYSIHPLILDKLQRRVVNHLPTSIVLMLAIISDLNNTPFLYQLLPHVDSVASRFTTRGSTPRSRCDSDMAAAFSSVYSVSGRYEEAAKIQLDLWSQCRRLLGEDHLDTVSAMQRLSDSWSALGRYEEAEKMRLDVLSRRKRLLGDDHLDTIWAMANLAWSWSVLGRYKEAAIMQQDVMLRRRRLLGEDHRDTVSAMHRLAWSCSELGRYEEAETMELDVLSRRRRLVGEDHPDTISAMHNLACTRARLGQHEEAEKMRLDAMSRYGRLLGEDHPNTVTAMSNLANSWSDLGRYQEAEKMRLEILSRRRRVLGEDHPDTISAMHGLACSWSDLGKHKEAEKLCLEVLSRRRRVLGEDHPDTVWAMNNLADICSDLGRHEEAEKMQRDVLFRRRRLLGENHPDAVQSMANLALTLAHLQHYPEAEKLCQDALERQRRIFGEDHSDTTRSGQWLIWIREQQDASEHSTEGDSRVLERLDQPRVDESSDPIPENLTDNSKTHSFAETEPRDSLARRLIPFLPLLLVPVLVLARRR